MRVVVPASHVAVPASAALVSARPDSAARLGQLVSALEGVGYELVDQQMILPRLTQPTAKPALRAKTWWRAPGPDTDRLDDRVVAGRPRGTDRRTAALRQARVEARVGPQPAIVLVDQGGCYSWRVPERTPSPRRTPGGPAGGGRARLLTLPLHGALRVSGPGWLIDDVLGDATAVVRTFVGPRIAGSIVDLLEGLVEPGLVHLRGIAPTTWRRVERLDQVPLPDCRPARVLVLVHGTFGSTQLAFGDLCRAPGRDFLADALAHYDAVVGFDHPTLSVDPLANARDLWDRVRGVPAGCTLDIVCHSRGGLTARALVELVLPGSDRAGSVDRIVFVGATNHGSKLAARPRWPLYADLMTNLLLARSGAGMPQQSVSAALGRVVRLVHGLATGLLEDRYVPGLTAMDPHGEFVRTINRVQPGQPASGASWFVVRSDFHAASAHADGHRPTDLASGLLRRLAEGVVDPIFEGPNDLVVDTASMGSIDVPVGGSSPLVRETLDLGIDDGVHHLGYFAHSPVSAQLRSWLTTDRPSPQPCPD